MKHFIEHPNYGRILSHEGWLNNDKTKTCSFCGKPVVIPGFCVEHHELLQYKRKALEEIIKFREENKSNG